VRSGPFRSDEHFDAPDDHLVYISVMSPSGKKNLRQRKLAEPTREGRAPRGSKSAPERKFEMFPTVSRPELLDKDRTTDRKFRQFLYDLSVLGFHLESARAYLASSLGISSPQYNIVMILAQYQQVEGISGSEVAKRLHVTTAFITSEIMKLERAGLVEKRQNPKDGRSVLLHLTEAGEAKVHASSPQRLWINDHLFEGISGKDFHHLAQTVGSLVDDFAHTIDMLKAIRKKPAIRAATWQ
jgi:DNA-binding MarR family transcriptional regulator